MGKNTVMGIPRKDFLILFVLYLIAHGGILLIPNAIYWDDWVLWSLDSSGLIDFAKEWGAFLKLTGYMNIAMLSIGPYIYRVLTFLLIFSSGVFLYRILQLQSWITKSSQLLIVMLYLVTPLYAARVSLSVFIYTLCLFFFFGAWFLIGKNRFFSLLSFFLSFNTQSLLVFYMLPILDWYFREHKDYNFPQIIKWSVRHIDYLVLPFVWFILKITFFKPFGFYEGYNEQYGLINLIKAPVLQLLDIFNLNMSLGFVLVGIVFSLLVCRFCGLYQESRPGNGQTKMNYVIGFIALISGLFPYWILGHVPTFTEWSSRHQLLMPLGVAILLSAIIVSCVDKYGRILLVLIITVSFAINWYNYAWFFIDWNKQNRLVSFLVKSEDVASAKLIVFEDRAKNALSREYRFYEWNGLMKMATGDETRFGIRWDEYPKYVSGEYDKYFNRRYIAADHRRSIDNKMVAVNISGYPFHYVFSVNKLTSCSIAH